MTDTRTSEKPQGAHNPGREGAEPFRPLSEKQRRELWMYLAVSIAAVELLITVGAVFYAFIGASAHAGEGAAAFSFPWLWWAGLSVALPSLLLLAVHFADVGLFRVPHSGPGNGQDGEKEGDGEWQKHLPLRLQKIYTIIKGAPIVVVLLGLIALAAALVTIDGALSALARFGSVLVPHLPVLIGGIAGVIAVIAVSAVWLNYRTRKLIAEYEFRREVLEKTGVIIVDKGSMQLPPAATEVQYALVSSEHTPEALPPGEENATTTSEETPASNTASGAS